METTVIIDETKKKEMKKYAAQFRRRLSKMSDETKEALSFRSIQALNKRKLSDLSSTIVHYIFRNGPVEDMHADGKLSDDDMKELNVFINDRVATLLHLLREEDWIRLELFFGGNGFYGSNWNEPVLQLDELDAVNELMFKLVNNQ